MTNFVSWENFPEIEMNLFADDLGNCKYEAIAESLTEDLSSQWMTNWSQELVKNA